MQVNQAYHDDCLVVWKKNRPEDFKDAENLLRGDRGGFTFEPEVGVHEGLYELDFSSLYPSIMVKDHSAAETLDCASCTDDGRPVPELRYHPWTRRVGIVGRVLKALIERRRYYKKMKKEPGPLQDIYTGRDTILKWTLVTSFGYQGYKNARFGRIECHEAINAYARNILVRTMEIAESHGYEVVHGIVDSVWLRPTANADPIEKVREHIAGSIGLPIELEGRYKWIVFLPCKTTGVGARDCERKVRVAEFLQGDEEPDAWEYIRLLCRSGQTLLAPFGYTEEKLARMCEDLSDISIANIPEQAITIQEDYKSIGESRSRARGGGGYKKPWRVVDEEEMPSKISEDL